MLFVLTAYIALQLALGLWVSRRIRAESDYLLAGRALGPTMVAMSVFATWFGAETCVGSAGAAYQYGLGGTKADPFGYAAAVLLFGLLLAVPLWKKGITTLADLFRGRYGGFVEGLAAVVLVPSSLIWAAAQIRAFGQIVATAGDVPLEAALALAATVVVIYTYGGGLWADAITDLVQGGILVLGLVALLVGIVVAMGGVGPFYTDVVAQGIDFTFSGGEERTWWTRLDAWAVPIVGSLCAQELAARSLAARSPTVARNGTLTAAALYITVGLIPVLIGLAARTALPDLEHPEQTLPTMAEKFLPSWFFVVFAGAVLSAILSSVDSALLTAGGLTSRNLILPWLKAPSEALKLRLARTGVLVYGVVAYLIARSGEGVYELVQLATAFGTGGVVVVLLFGLFSRFGGAGAASAALVCGVLVNLGMTVFEAEGAFLSSLGCALAAYLIVATVERYLGFVPPKEETISAPPDSVAMP